MKALNFTQTIPSTASTTNVLEAIDISSCKSLSAVVACGAATSAGTFKVQGSNGNSEWVDIAAHTGQITTGTITNAVVLPVSIPDITYNLVRLSVTSSGGAAITGSVRWVGKA